MTICTTFLCIKNYGYGDTEKLELYVKKLMYSHILVQIMHDKGPKNDIIITLWFLLTLSYKLNNERKQAS
jgi:hypothetical protein